jgi:uroporphyrin-III C-methyltransferase/precorrin-2 dehydrogenase/sirohydrochlorin ferrochelatase/uroporphyrin-III C-methyltransferase
MLSGATVPSLGRQMTRIAKVYLVGGGPGDPDLLTVKALRLLKIADVVVHDRLISPAVLELIPESISRISVGKAAGKHCIPQAEINALLVDLCKTHAIVVRLKGGDPFTFGRGSEEALHLSRLGIAFEVVPGITAATACSAYSGIPLTHRGLSRSVRFITGHFLENEKLDLDWRSLAVPDLTIVVYMGLANIGRVCDGLLNFGMDPATPAVAIQDGTTDRQRRVFGDLATLPNRVKGSRLAAPVLIIIGRTVALAGALDWFVTDKERVHHALAGAVNY